MASQSPTVEEMLQQMLIYHQATKNAIQDYLVNRSNTTNVRLKVERVESVELSNSMAVYPAPIPVQQTNPLASTSSTSDKDNNESSIANPDNEEDLARVLDEASETPVLSKRNSSIDVLVDLLNVQLNRPTSISVNSISMMISQDAQQAAESSPMQCAQSPLPSLEGEDSASVERSYSEILFHDPVNPQESPLVMANLQDPDSSTDGIDIDDSPTTSSIAASPQRTCEDMSN